MTSILVVFTILLAVCVIFLALIFRRLTKTHQKLRVERSHIQALVDSIPDLTWVKDKESRFLMVNRQFSRVFGLPIEDILGKSDVDLSDSEEQARRYMADDQMVMNTREAVRREELVADIDGAETWAETIKVPVVNDQGLVIGTAGIARDISERKASEKRMQHLAHHDVLTDLPNRVLLELRVKHALIDHANQEDQLVVVFIDLDNFKVINDTVNHAVGDQVLVAVAKRLRHMVRKEDIVARIGGDEFIVVFPHTKLSQAEELADKLMSTLTQPVMVEEMSFEVTMSMGVAVYPVAGDDCWSLIQHADLAMYHAKQSGKNQVAFFSENMASRSQEKMSIDARIESALERNEFEVFYQPVVNMQSFHIDCVEALLRWHDPITGGYLLPEEFIPSAERSGFIVKLGDWLIEEVMSQLYQWKSHGIETPISFNISAAQLHQNRLLAPIQQGLERFDIPGRMLQVELNENIVTESTNAMIENLEALQRLGVQITVDDFGTGYSNLANLSRLPLNGLKIDHLFVNHINEHENHRQVAGAIVEMAKSMHLKVVAEGIESVEEYNEMLALGVDQAQGFYFDRPMPPSEATERLLESRPYLAKSG